MDFSKLGMINLIAGGMLIAGILASIGHSVVVTVGLSLGAPLVIIQGYIMTKS